MNRLNLLPPAITAQQAAATITSPLASASHRSLGAAADG